MISAQAAHYGSLHYMGEAPPPPPPPPPFASFLRRRPSYKMLSSSPGSSRQSHVPASNWNNEIYKVMYNHNPQYSYDDQNEPDVSILRSPPTPMRSSLRSRSRSGSRFQSRRNSRPRSRSRSQSRRRVSFAGDDSSTGLRRRNSAPARSYSSIDSIGSFRLYDDRSRSPSPRAWAPQQMYTGVADDFRTRLAAHDSAALKQTNSHSDRQRRKRHSKHAESRNGDGDRLASHDHNRKQRRQRRFLLRNRAH